ncbi:TetR/AcrR family transcriptional regulator [Gilvimarinus algae]|uniref:TetR/AcrR family transcriptional regulator n=1 Tax=Gilvimarinus algae TaxID=3058037 RepID=A0ABT8T9R0_9GAMM|nr:TetR/AcrR family transcriptional regulator [Gilvimarinus sp. SDUM040014]MDO3380625.1 TetR/AcrR family transcriptional regulator [Gilvimarinus sp. SDUM040014]
MADKATDQRIVAAADDLFYRQGYEHTSFRDIAEAVGISRGNFYHHYKSKDDILRAVIERRLDNTRLLLRQWEQQASSPLDRIICFVKILTTNWAKIRLYGCPVGTLTTELSKLDHPAKKQASEVLTLFRQWLKAQFIALEKAPEKADELAMHVLAFSQGVATLASAYRDKAFVQREIDGMCKWLTQLAAQQE